MKKGFTLVELLGVIILLGILLMIVYPKTMEISNEKQKDIDSAKVKLIQNAAFGYLEQDRNKYPRTLGNTYCLSLEALDQENLIPVDIKDVLEKYSGIKVKIGKNKTNSYTFYTLQEECQEVKN